MTQAILLFSGGLDSTVLLAHALDEGVDFRVLEFEYPGRPRGEREAARTILAHYGIDGAIHVPMPAVDGASLVHGPGKNEGFVPLRNLWFHTTAAVVARQIGATRILVAHLDQDALDFPDARPDYFRRLRDLIQAGSLPDEEPLAIERVFEGKSKLAVARRGRELDAPLELTWGCYRDQDEPCSECDGCKERKATLNST